MGYAGAVTSVAALDALDARIRAALVAEPGVRHALAYGSRTQVGPDGAPASDGWSDLEYWAFLESGETLDAFAFLRPLMPVALAVVNPYGTPNVVTPDLVRVELHMVDGEQLAQISTWPNAGTSPDRMLIKDADGALRARLEELATRPIFAATLPGVQALYDGVLNDLVFGSAVLARGEELRAWDLLTPVRGGLLRLVRVLEGLPQPLAPTRRAERELPEGWREALRGTVSGQAASAYGRALTVSRRLAAVLRLEERAVIQEALAARLRALTGEESRQPGAES
ncbi:hypothetical protein DAERI_050124 [Deinococcus aerius]|uniref:Lincosamide nucleotidyltransferase-like C-terminal domain-containing protein n=1 Tax=Deinococcus aerius TaxID=200253 RepID=A0A2I9DXV0_9DEIO|nr:hypothetical protein DAERI_050124 [Deinococcus aerius]